MWPFSRKTEKRAISFQDFWGSGADLDSVRVTSVSTALTLAPVWASTRLIADSIAALPLQAFRKAGETRQKIDAPPLLTDPSLFGGQFEWVQRPLYSLLLRGNAYGLVTRLDGQGMPRQIEWLHPDEVSLEQDETTVRPKWFWKGRTVEPWTGRDSSGQLLHIPWIVLPGQILGQSPIRAFANTIETGILAQRYGKNWFANDAVPSGVLETEQKVNQEQAEEIKERFMASAKGRKPVVLGAGAMYKPITVPPEESQFLETIKANANQIASIYGVPPEMIGGEAGSSLTYANVEQQSLNLVRHSLQPYMEKMEQHISGLLPRPQFVKFNVDSLQRADLKTRYQAYQAAAAAKILTPNEIRALEDLPPIPGGDVMPDVRPPAGDNEGEENE